MKYQRLQRENTLVAYDVAKQLKEHKVLSDKDYKNIFFQIKVNCGDHPKNFESVTHFLFQHGIMTSTMINGFRIYVATQKCVKAKKENLFVEEHYVMRSSYDKAKAYIAINLGRVPVDIEAKIIAENIFYLPKEMKKEFIKNYTEIMATTIEHAISHCDADDVNEKERHLNITLAHVTWNIKGLKVGKK